MLLNTDPQGWSIRRILHPMEEGDRKVNRRLTLVTTKVTEGYFELDPDDNG
jgi:hypothetical protein